MLLLTLTGTRVKAQEVFLKGRYTEVGIHRFGSFGTRGAAPSGYHPKTLNLRSGISSSAIGFVCDYEKNGWTTAGSGQVNYMGDYFVPGAPEEGWMVEWDDNRTGTTSTNKRAFGLMGDTSMTFTSHVKQTFKGYQVSIWKGSAISGTTKQLDVTQTTRLDSLNQFFTIEVLLKNSGSDTLFKLEYLRNVDPDNEVAWTSPADYTTRNYVLKQPNGTSNKDTAVVVAESRKYGVPCILGTIDSRAKVSVEGFSNRDPDAIYDSPVAPTKASPSVRDEAIALAYRFGDLAPGKCVIFTYYYALAQVNIADVFKPVRQNFVMNNNVDEIPVAEQLICGDTTITFKNRSTGAGVQYVDKVEWDFDNDGKFDKTGDSVVYTFKGHKRYKVRQKITLCTGKVYDSTFNIRLYAKPVPSFTGPLSKCLKGNVFNFKNTSAVYKDTILRYRWTVGTTQYKDSTNLSGIKFGTTGTYNVKLFAESVKGCRDSVTRKIYVNPDPKAAYSVNDTDQCRKWNSFAFTNKSSISSGRFTSRWDLGDKTTDTATSPAYTYSSHAAYQVKLVVKSDSGCLDSVTRKMIVWESPKAGITLLDTQSCLKNNRFAVVNTTTYSDTSKLTHDWRMRSVSSKLRQPVFVADSNGTFTIRLIETSPDGCRDTAVKTIVVHPDPRAAFSINDTIPCFEWHRVVTSNLSTINAGSMKWNWKWGDGNADTARQPVKRYTAYGTRTITLVATSDKGCKDSISRKINVRESPIAAFVQTDTQVCLPGHNIGLRQVSRFSDTQALSFSWNTADGNTYSTKSLKKIWAAAGNYNVSLVVKAGNGCADTAARLFRIYSPPRAIFYTPDSIQCLRKNIFSLLNRSTGGTGTSLKYTWRFSDGKSDTGRNPAAHSYADTGLFTVRLLISDDKSCRDSLTKTMRVLESPVARFTVNDSVQCLRGNTVGFSNLTTFSKLATLTYNWNFNNGNTSTQKNPGNQVYTSSGLKLIRLAVWNAFNGCTDTTSQTVRIAPHPIAAFTVNRDSQCLRNHSYTFTNGSSSSYGTLNYRWSFGNGKTDTATHISAFRYSTDSVWRIRLIAANLDACEDTSFRQVYLFREPKAIIGLSAAEACLKGNRFTFTDKSTTKQGWLTARTWNTGDGDTASTAVTRVKSYNDTGIFNVSLIIFNSPGCGDTAYRAVTIHPQIKQQFTINRDSQCLRGNDFRFTNLSAIGSGSFSHKWYFGDGDSSSQSSPGAKVYNTDGRRTVTLVSVSGKGCRDTLSRQVQIMPDPRAAFTVNDSSQCLAGNSFSLTNNSTLKTGAITRYFWTFGDGSSSAGQSPAARVYTAAGSYNIALRVWSDFGCADSTKQTMWLHPSPQLAFTANKDSQCWRNNNFTFANRSTISAGSVSYKWNSSDKDSGKSTNWTGKVFAQPIDYSITLTGISDQGCPAVLTRQVSVMPEPRTAFSCLNPGQCLKGNRFEWFDLSSISRGSYNVVRWRLGDGTTSTAKNPKHTYAAAGTYTYRLITRSAFGCMDSAQATVRVHPQTTPSFTINKPVQCFNGHSLGIENKSSMTGGTFSSAWYLSDGRSFDSVRFNGLTFAGAGIYNVMLVNVTNQGCRDTLIRPVTLNPNPVADFRFSDTFQCLRAQNLSVISKTTVSSGTFSNSWNSGDGRDFYTTDINNLKYAAGGNYTLWLKSVSDKGCRDSASRNIRIRSNNALRVVVNDSVQCFNYHRVDLSPATISTTYPVVMWKWHFGDGNTSDFTNPAPFTYAAPGVYPILLATRNADGCYDTSVSRIEINPNPVLSITTDTVCAPAKNTFTASEVLPFGTVAMRGWELSDGYRTGSRDFIRYMNLPGRYNALYWAETGKGCRDTVTTTAGVWLKPRPRADFSWKRQPVKTIDVIEVQFTSQSSPDVIAWNWWFDKALPQNVPNPLVTWNDTGRFATGLMVENAEGCRDTAERLLPPMYPEYLMYIPNAYTPNGDQLNDGYGPVGTRFVKSYEMIIINRWGQIVFKSNDFSRRWDGTYMGKPAPSGVYAVRISLDPFDGPLKVYETNLTLIR